MVELSPNFAEDETVFLGTFDSTANIWYSNDGGNRFKEQLRAPQDDGTPMAIFCFVATDEETILCGADSKVLKTTNNGNSWKDYDCGSDPVQALVLAPGYAVDGAEDEGHILASTAEWDAGYWTGDGHVFRSTDTGKKWSELKSRHDNMTGYVVPGFDAEYAENSTIYCSASGTAPWETAADGGVFRYVKGESTKWVRIDGGAGAPSADDGEAERATGLVVSPDGTLYATDSTHTEGISRCLDPTTSVVTSDPFFEQVNDTVEGTITGGFHQLWMTTGSSNVLWTIYADPDFNTDYWGDGSWDPASFFGDNIYTLTDTLTGGVTLNSPANGTSSMRVEAVTFQWEAIEGAKKYQLEVDTQENFKGAQVLYDTTKDTTYTWVDIPAAWFGVPLFWRVRVYEQEPYRSNWSDKWTFSTQLVEGQWNPFVGGVPEAPYNGATNVSLTPTFAWNAADWATGYEFELADNAAFTSPMVKKTLDGTVYLHGEALGNSTTYYWRVRAVNAATQSEWATGVFTTMAAPPPPPPSPEPAPTPPAPILPPPAIPNYLLWTIVGIGAALIIAVIILIVRTRRAI
jgi:hypothetical protein